MYEEKLCNQVREDDYFDSFKDVNKVIDDIINLFGKIKWKRFT